MNLAGALAAVVAVLMPPTGLATVPGSVHCVVRDPRIDESSGLVDLGSLMVTANDSGDTGRVFVLDDRCRTVGVRSYGSARDVEALAPAGDHAVWVGDTGDNTSSRAHVVVRRLPVGRGDRAESVASYELVYPDGPHDAETLLRDPASGRLYVVTKQLLASEVYAAPPRLDPDRPNRLRRVAEVSLTPTDGSFLPGGRRVLLRGYQEASTYSFPGWRLLSTVRLPAQPQGESLSVGPGGRVRIGSEGLDQPVLDVTLPVAASPSRVDDSAPAAGQDRGVDPRSTPLLTWSLAAAAVALLLLAGAGLLVRARRR